MLSCGIRFNQHYKQIFHIDAHLLAGIQFVTVNFVFFQRWNEWFLCKLLSAILFSECTQVFPMDVNRTEHVFTTLSLVTLIVVLFFCYCFMQYLKKQCFYHPIKQSFSYVLIQSLLRILALMGITLEYLQICKLNLQGFVMLCHRSLPKETL